MGYSLRALGRRLLRHVWAWTRERVRGAGLPARDPDGGSRAQNAAHRTGRDTRGRRRAPGGAPPDLCLIKQLGREHSRALPPAAGVQAAH